MICFVFILILYFHTLLVQSLNSVSTMRSVWYISCECSASQTSGLDINNSLIHGRHTRRMPTRKFSPFFFTHLASFIFYYMKKPCPPSRYLANLCALETLLDFVVFLTNELAHRSRPENTQEPCCPIKMHLTILS